MPQRRDWHRIVVALPAYRALDFDGMPGRLEGFGLFMQPNCQSDPRSCGLAVRPPSAPEAYGPDDQEVRANYFVAPFSYVSIVILDPATLAVLDREHKLDYRRYFDPVGGALDLAQNIPKEVLAPKVVNLIERIPGKRDLAHRARGEGGDPRREGSEARNLTPVPARKERKSSPRPGRKSGPRINQPATSRPRRSPRRWRASPPRTGRRQAAKAEAPRAKRAAHPPPPS